MHDVISRIDAHRARRIGEMLVAQGDELEVEPNLLIDIANLDGKQLLENYRAKRAKFATAPFDPEGHQFRFYPGGVTIWSGFPGAGKTTLLRQFVCHTLHRGSSVFMASLEDDPQDVLVDLASTAAGQVEPDCHQMQWFIDAYAERLRVWGKIGVTQHLQLLATIRHAAKQGIRHAVIDSLMLLDISNDDLEAQRKFAALLAAIAKADKIHVHLVAHPRKLISADQELDLNDVAGAREIGGIADNVLFVKRSTDKGHYDPSADVTPMTVGIRKQRHFMGGLGDVKGWFHRHKRQFTLDQFGQITRYLPDHAYGG